MNRKLEILEVQFDLSWISSQGMAVVLIWTEKGWLFSPEIHINII